MTTNAQLTNDPLLHIHQCARIASFGLHDSALCVRQRQSDATIARRTEQVADMRHWRGLVQTKPLYDVDVQGPRAVTCGLDKTVVLWTADTTTP